LIIVYTDIGIIAIVFADIGTIEKCPERIYDSLDIGVLIY
jgi:hypothetical protein